MPNHDPQAQTLALLIQDAFEQAHMLNIVVSALLAAIISRQPQLKDELLHVIDTTPTDNENVLQFKQQARHFIESIPVWVA
jgi:hypothetical protein